MSDYLGSSDDYLGGLGLDEGTQQQAPANDPWGSQDPYAQQEQSYGDPYASQAQPMQQYGEQAELSVQAPYLEDVQPGIQTMGSASDLSSHVLDIEVPVEVFFGDASVAVNEFMEMGPGSVIELDHGIEQPIELRVKGKLVAKGQLVTINGNYGLRITQMTEQGA